MDYQVIKSDPTSEIVSLAEAKENAKIDFSDEDTAYQLILDGAQEFIERYTGRVFRQRDIEIHLAAWAQNIELPIDTLQSITKISYLGNGGSEQTLDPESYKFYAYDPYKRVLLIKSQSLPDLDPEDLYPVRIKGPAGFASEDMPADVKNAALLLFGQADQFREDMGLASNRSAERLLRSHRKY